MKLHPKTAALVDRFAAALKEKLAAAEEKYGYSDTGPCPHADYCNETGSCANGCDDRMPRLTDQDVADCLGRSFDAAALAERLVRDGYQLQLETALRACTAH